MILLGEIVIGNKSKAKGTAYEQKIANKLSNELKKEFRRVPLSGSIDYLKGDIWVPADTAWWPYCIEAKHYKDLQWNNLLTSKTTDILNFWKQTLRESEVMNKKPLLIFRWNRSKDFIGYIDDFNDIPYIEIKSFGYKFKISLLEDWINAFKREFL